MIRQLTHLWHSFSICNDICSDLHTDNKNIHKQFSLEPNFYHLNITCRIPELASKPNSVLRTAVRSISILNVVLKRKEINIVDNG